MRISFVHKLFGTVPLKCLGDTISMVMTRPMMMLVMMKIMVMKIGEDDGDDSYAEKRR